MVMAKLTAQARLKTLFNGERMSVGFDPKDPSHYKFIGAGAGGGGSGLRLTDVSPNLFLLHKRKLMGCSGSSSTRIFASSSSKSSVGNKSKHLNGKDSSSKVTSEIIYDELLGDPDYETDDLSCFRGLVLDISYRPINVVCWKRAICLEFMEKADVLEYYDQTVNSPSGSFYIPAVLRVPHLLQVVKRRRIKNTLSRKNILSRDNFACQYCSSSENLTIDHVLPISRGGEWTWENLVTACFSCNSRKGQKTLEEAKMNLLKVPKAPKDYDIVAIPLTNTAIKMLRMRKGTPEEWHQYLSKPSP